MRIAKPLLLVLTPLGVVGAVIEAFRVGGGLGFLLVALLVLVSIAATAVVLTIRREAAAEKERPGDRAPPTPTRPSTDAGDGRP